MACLGTEGNEAMKSFRLDPPVRSLSLPTRFGELETCTVFLMAHILEMGGTQRHFAQLATALRRKKVRVRLGCNLSQGYFAETLRAEWEIAEFRLGDSFFSRRALSSARALARFLRSHEVSIAHSFSFYSNLMMIPVARMARVPIVIGSHRQLGDLLTHLQFTVQTVLLQLCDRVVCNSQAASGRLIARGLSPSKVVVIPNAVCPEIFAVGNRGKQPLRASTVKVGMIARMSAGKGHRFLLRAVARLRNKSRGIHLLLAGDGPERFQLETMTEQMGLTNQVTFLGQCPDVAGLLAKLDISVLVSSSESSPNAIAESMAAGLPIVATRVGGIPELISHGETGLLVPMDDDVELADAIEYLAENPDVCARLGQNALEFAMRHFRVDQVCQAYEQLYAELLDSRELNNANAIRQH
jgi:glycosyltransferase involved in cell wall biosynthesis